MDERIVSDELMYEGPICRVHRIGLRADNGRVLPRDLIELAQATVIVPVLDDGALVLVANRRFAVGEVLLEFPAGKLDAGEGPDGCAARELVEETGYSAGRIERLGGFYTSPGAITEYVHAYLATGLSPGRQQLQDSEHIDVRTVGAADLERMVREGEIHDAKSIAAWALWRMREKR